MDRSFQFTCEGPGIPATGTIQVSGMDPAKTGAHIASNERSALLLAQWLFDHTTAHSCRILHDGLTRLLGDTLEGYK